MPPCLEYPDHSPTEGWRGRRPPEDLFFVVILAAGCPLGVANITTKKKTLPTF